MENEVNSVQKGIRNNRKSYSSEEKLAIVQEWKQQGVNLEEVCRKYGLHAHTLRNWKRALDRGLEEKGALVPKSQVLALQKKVEELERALGRKALETDILKKAFELKGLRLPDGI